MRCWLRNLLADFVVCVGAVAVATVALARADEVPAIDQSSQLEIVLASDVETDYLAQIQPPPATLPTQPVRPNNPGPLALAPQPSRTSTAQRTLTAYSLASTPFMIGDSLGVRYRWITGGDVSLAAGDRAAKIADDSRPLPTDRIFFDYNFFDQSNLTANGAVIGLDRYVLGFEKTFCDGNCSLEVRAPIDSGLNSTQIPTASTTANEGTVFGQLAIIPKILLCKSCTSALATGLIVDIPTTPDSVLQFARTTDVRVHDEAVHIEPFLGLQCAPNERLFSITYLQLDFDANGDSVSVRQTSSQPIVVGRMQDPTLLYVDAAVGYWLFHYECCECEPRSYLTGLAPVIELHYSTTLQNCQSVGPVQAVSQRVDILNLTAGVHFQIGPLSTLTIAGVAPLRTGQGDKQFDSELAVRFNRRF